MMPVKWLEPPPLTLVTVIFNYKATRRAFVSSTAAQILRLGQEVHPPAVRNTSFTRHGNGAGTRRLKRRRGTMGTAPLGAADSAGASAVLCKCSHSNQ